MVESLASGRRGRHRIGNNDLVFLGDDLLAWLVLALGGALAVGNILAIIKPPPARREDTDLERAPVARSLGMAAIGLVAALWGLVTLLGS